MYKAEISSPVGRLTLSSDGKALTGLWINGQKYFASTLEKDAQNFPTLPIFLETVAWLEAYFAKEPLPPLPTLAPKGSGFRQAVWDILLDIPFGKTSTYGNISKTLRERGIPASAQAVGGAVGHNPILILIPCHRVLGANGRLTGYAGGLEIKRQLLLLEGITN